MCLTRSSAKVHRALRKISSSPVTKRSILDSVGDGAVPENSNRTGEARATESGCRAWRGGRERQTHDPQILHTDCSGRPGIRSFSRTVPTVCWWANRVMAMSGTPSPWRFIPPTSCLAVAISRCFVRRTLETAELTTLERVGEIIAVCQKPVKLGKAQKVTVEPFRIPF